MMAPELLSSLNSTGPTLRTVALIVDASADEALIPETCASCGTKEPIVVLTMSGGCADEPPWRMCRSCWGGGEQLVFRHPCRQQGQEPRRVVRAL